MKKLFFILSIVLILISCDNGGMENEDEYYPYEVTNLQYTIEKDELVVIVVTWDNPTDENFLKVRYGRGLPDTDPSKPNGENSTQIVCPDPPAPHTFYCISKDGKVSKGVRCDFGYTYD